MAEALRDPSAEGLDEGNHHKDAPQSVDHAGDGGEKLDDKTDKVTSVPGQEIFAQKDGNGQPRRESQQQGDDRGGYGSDKEGQHTVAVAVGLPLRAGQKTKAVFLQGRFGFLENLPENPAEHEDRGGCGDRGEPAEKIRKPARHAAMDAARAGLVGRHGEADRLNRWWKAPRWPWPRRTRAAGCSRDPPRRTGPRSVRR